MSLARAQTASSRKAEVQAKTGRFGGDVARRVARRVLTLEPRIPRCITPNLNFLIISKRVVPKGKCRDEVAWQDPSSSEIDPLKKVQKRVFRGVQLAKAGEHSITIGLRPVTGAANNSAAAASTSAPPHSCIDYTQTPHSCIDHTQSLSLIHI